MLEPRKERKQAGLSRGPQASSSEARNLLHGCEKCPYRNLGLHGATCGVAERAVPLCGGRSIGCPSGQMYSSTIAKSKDLVRLLTAIAGQVNVARLTRTTRGPKKPRAQKRIYDNKHKHRPTARLLEEGENSC